MNRQNCALFLVYFCQIFFSKSNVLSIVMFASQRKALNVGKRIFCGLHHFFTEPELENIPGWEIFWGGGERTLGGQKY